MDFAGFGLAGLFVAAFLAATFVPFQSEVVLAAMQAADTHPWPLLFAVATAGNVLGSYLNWVLGRYFSHFADRRWFPVPKAAYERAVGWFGRWGIWSLLLAWTPFLGDPLTVAAGVLRVRFLPFVLLVAIGKAARYLVLVAAVAGWT